MVTVLYKGWKFVMPPEGKVLLFYSLQVALQICSLFMGRMVATQYKAITVCMIMSHKTIIKARYMREWAIKITDYSRICFYIFFNRSVKLTYIYI